MYPYPDISFARKPYFFISPGALLSVSIIMLLKIPCKRWQAHESLVWRKRNKSTGFMTCLLCLLWKWHLSRYLFSLSLAVNDVSIPMFTSGWFRVKVSSDLTEHMIYSKQRTGNDAHRMIGGQCSFQLKNSERSEELNSNCWLTAMERWFVLLTLHNLDLSFHYEIEIIKP